MSRVFKSLGVSGLKCVRYVLVTGFTSGKKIQSFDVLTLWNLLAWISSDSRVVLCTVVIVRAYFGLCTLAFHFAQELDNISNSSHRHRVIEVD